MVVLKTHSGSTRIENYVVEFQIIWLYDPILYSRAHSRTHIIIIIVVVVVVVDHRP